MWNPRISAKERGLIKGALRRVFSRSDLRKKALQASIVDHTDPSRSRVKKWSRCPLCSEFTPTYQMEVDHVAPVVPVTSSLEEMSVGELIDNTWCEENNLLAICKPCHYNKSKGEAKLRRQHKKDKKNGKGR